MRNVLSSHRVRLLSAAAAVLMGILMCGMALAAEALSYPFNSVTNDRVNMRSRASSSSVVLERLDKGQAVTVTGASGSYFKVSYNNRTGYILKTYISTEAGTMVTPTPEPVEVAYGYPYQTVTTAKVAMRAERAKNGKIIQNLPAGTVITVTKVTGTYAWVTYGSQTGFIKTDYVKLKTVCSPTPMPTATPDPNALYDYPVLQKGSSGTAVTYLQYALSELGFYGGAATGIFDEATEGAVFEFQAKNGLHYTGVCDSSQQAMIYCGKTLNSSGTSVTVTVVSPLYGITVVPNQTGPLVQQIQTRLNELGYLAGPITGAYDKDTVAAMKAFQKKNKLSTTNGYCDVSTQNVLFSSSAVDNASPAATKAAATVTPAPAQQVPGTTVRRGSTGSDAKMVQKQLKALGYYNGKVDGKFGSNSVAALKEFQKANGLKDDGIAGASTYVVLFGAAPVTAEQAKATPTPVPTADPSGATPAPTAITADNVVTVRLNSTGDVVVAIQTRLKDLGYYSAEADGTFKEVDVAALKTFQNKNALKADGIAGYDTQVKLFSDSALNAAGQIVGGTGAGLDTSITLRKGMNGEAVLQLQNRLIALGYLTGTADGIYGRATAAAVYNFQKANGLPKDSVAGPATLALIYSENAGAMATATPAPSATPAPTAASSTMKKGDTSAAVQELQEQLIAMGYLKGKADGKFGTATMQALIRFQRANGLKADGVAGAATIAALTGGKAVDANGVSVTPTPTPTVNVYASQNFKPKAADVKYANWYTTVKSVCRKYPYATVYDFSTGISWQVHMFSLGAHADAEPLTAADTAKMERAFGGNTWNPKAVWVVFADGSVYLASTHSMPHEVQHRKDNNFDGHTCIHFPRTEAQVAAIGSYATSHQASIDAGWAATQAMK